jgi:phosphoribosylamine-glycine ligase
VVGLGETFEDAQNRANQGASEVHFEGAWFRKDIGKRLFNLAVGLPV